MQAEAVLLHRCTPGRSWFSEAAIRPVSYARMLSEHPEKARDSVRDTESGYGRGLIANWLTMILGRSCSTRPAAWRRTWASIQLWKVQYGSDYGSYSILSIGKTVGNYRRGCLSGYNRNCNNDPILEGGFTFVDTVDFKYRLFARMRIMHCDSWKVGENQRSLVFPQYCSQTYAIANKITTPSINLYVLSCCIRWIEWQLNTINHL